MRLQVETELNTAAEIAWEVIGKQYAEIDKWTPTVNESRVTREDEIPNGITIAKDAPVPGRVIKSNAGTFNELLTAYSNEERMFTFVGYGLPKIMVSHSENTTRINDLGNENSSISFDITIKFRPWFFFIEGYMKKRMSEVYSGVQNDLKKYLTTKSN